MRYQQLRILAFIVGAFTHKSETALFWCTDEFRVIKCHGDLLGNGNYFYFSTSPGCTPDVFYCAAVTGESSDGCTISVTDYGKCDSGDCLPQPCNLNCQWEFDGMGG